MYPNSIYFSLKVAPLSVIWGQSIYYLGTWTFRVCFAVPRDGARNKHHKEVLRLRPAPSRRIGVHPARPRPSES